MGPGVTARPPQGVPRIQSLGAPSTFCKYAPLIVNKHACQALVDSGNMWRTAISDKFARQLGLHETDLQPVQQKRVGMAKAGESLEVMGETKRPLTVRFGACPQVGFSIQPVVIKDLGMAMNLAGPTMKQLGVDQLHSKDSLRVRGQLIKLHSDCDLRGRTEIAAVPLHLHQAVRLPPLSVCHTDVRAALPECEGILVLGNMSLLEQRGVAPWLSGFATTSFDGGLRVGLCNLTEEEVLLKEGTRYGDVIRSCKPEQEEQLPWRIATLGPVHAKKKLTTRQKLDDIIHNLRTKQQKAVEKPEETPAPETDAERREWLSRKFKLDENQLLGDAPAVCRKVIKLLLEYWDVVSVSGEYGETDLLEHAIHTAEAAPIKCRNRPINPALESDLERQLKDWLHRGVIERSNSPWSFPLVAAPKRNGKIRWCVDYRRLNAVTVKDTYPLPLIEDNLAKLADSKVFSCLDGAGAFHVLPVKEQDKVKTAFSTPFGLYHFRRMPFGLTNGPASYSRLIQLALQDLPTTTAIPYLDDVIVHSAHLEGHVEDLRRTLEAHRQAGLKLQPDKCALFQTKVEYLGHVVSADGIQLVPDYVKLVQDWPVPTTRSEIRIFLGKVGYYRRFIQGYSGIAAPLHEQVGKGTAEEERTAVDMTPEIMAAFRFLKQKLLEAPILAYPRFNSDQPFILDTDWSQENNAIGGVLSHKQDGKERVITYGGKKLSEAQARYGATKGELTALLHFAKLWRYYLRHRPFIFRTDHQPLKYLGTMEPPDLHTARMLDTLASYNFTVEYRPGPKHGNADALSRAPQVRCQPPSTTDVGTDEEDSTLAALMPPPGPLTQYSLDVVAKQQADDEILRPVVKAVKKGKRPDHLDRLSLPPDTRTY